MLFLNARINSIRIIQKMKMNIPSTGHVQLDRWIQEVVTLCHPSYVHLCTGTEEEYESLVAQLTQKGTFVPLKRPNSYWCHSHPDDVARVEESTFICTEKKEDAGPTNQWMAPSEMKKRLSSLFKNCMEGRTLYIIPYCMGPMRSPYSLIGIELTDSPYVVLNMRWMTRMGTEALRVLGQGKFVPGLHSVGVPLKKGETDLPWPCNPAQRVIAHFPEDPLIASFGSGYGGNALLAKKCFALRIASYLGKKEGWLAEHMLILGITNPQGEKKYIAAAFPSACGKTNLAMMNPTIPGWKIETVGDDIAWLHVGSDGRLYAINPEAGYFGVAPGTSWKTNPNAMKTIEKNTLFTNVALTKEKDVWWEGMSEVPPKDLTSWLGVKYDPLSGQTAAHPNGRFTVSAKQNPMYDPSAENPNGVPLSAIIFGGRRASTIPLVREATDWVQGVFFGAITSSETTAAAKGEVGKLRHDPFAMLPFCGYHMGDYFAHWLDIGRKASHAPRIYYVNWFLKDRHGKYIWPGFGENTRVLQWIFERTSERAGATWSPIGNLPLENEFDLSSLATSFSDLFFCDKKQWVAECQELEAYFAKFKDRMPQELLEQLSNLKMNLVER